MSTTYSLDIQQPYSDNDILKGLRRIDSEFSKYLAKFVILHSRSSGVDKMASFFQYGSMFYGDVILRLTKAYSLKSLFLSKIAPFKESESRWWVLLEDSMSSGRKVLRLFKWMKEVERAKLSLNAKKSVKTLSLRLLTFIAHLFAACYYFFDNLIWATQIGLLNSTRHRERQLLRLFKNDAQFEQYKEYQLVYKDFLKAKGSANKRIEGWKNIRNFSSLYRLLFAVFLNLITIFNAKAEVRRLESKYEDEVNNDRIEKIRQQTEEKYLETVAVSCNLLMTLSRLKFRYFKELPLYSIGLMGMVAGAIGIRNNWPKQTKRLKKE